MRMPSFARRHPWIGLLIVVTIGVASWMLLRAPHPATESMPLAAAGSEASKPAGPPWLYGRADARFTVVGYADLECPYCRAYFPALKRWIDAHPEVNWQWHHLPLSMREPAATAGARLAECAGEDGRTCHVLAGRGVALRAHPWRRPGSAGGPALSRPHASHAGLSRQRAPRCGHPCPGGGSGTAGHRGHAGPATARPRVRQDPPAARSRRRRCLAVGHRPARRRQHDRSRTSPFPRHARRRRR